jgi:hypothetical protein
MTRLSISLLGAFLLICAGAVPALAQTPATGQFAAGADIGVLLPADAFENALTVDGFGEFYLTPRVSFRPMLAWANPGVDNLTEDHLREVKLLFNVVYNWEGGSIHPFVTGGAGAYFVRLKREDRADPDGETRGGINLGGGAEFFTSNTLSIKGEARWDIVSHPPGLPDATGLSLTIGVKRYF